MPRPQFTLRALLVAMLVVGAFFGGLQFERARRRRADESAAANSVPIIINTTSDLDWGEPHDLNGEEALKSLQRD